MPISFSVDHSRRFVTAVASGDVTREDLIRHFELVRTMQALAYSEALSGRAYELALSGTDAGAAVGWMRGAAADLALGPMAVVAPNERTFGSAHMLEILTQEVRHVRAFLNRGLAHDWFAAIAAD